MRNRFLKKLLFFISLTCIVVHMLIISYLNTKWSIPPKNKKTNSFSPYQLGISTVRFCIYNQIQLLNL